MSLNLDKINYQKVDPDSMLTHLENFPKLCQDAWNIASDFALPSFYIKCRKYVLLGMGGSGIANDIMVDLLKDKNIIIESVHDYNLPGWVDKETIVIASSYSGNTEETLSAFIEAQNAGAKLLVITSGGRIEILSKKYKAPLLLFNYDCKPRASFPYFFGFLCAIFNRLGVLDLATDEFIDATEFAESELQKYKTATHTAINPAKLLALKCFNRIPIIYGSSTLSSVARRFKSQLNENSKNLSFHELFPELNHNAIEGYLYPKNLNINIILLESNFDFSRYIKRQNLTSHLLKSKKISTDSIKLVTCESHIAEIMTMVMFGDFVSYYLSILNKVDPSTNNTISNFKNQLEG